MALPYVLEPLEIAKAPKKSLVIEYCTSILNESISSLQKRLITTHWFQYGHWVGKYVLTYRDRDIVDLRPWQIRVVKDLTFRLQDDWKSI